MYPFRTSGRAYVAKALQKYILALAQQVATDQGRPIVISSLVARLHRRLQNVKGENIKNPPDDEKDPVLAEAEGEGDDSSEGELKIVITDSSSEEAPYKKRTRASKRKKMVSS